MTFEPFNFHVILIISLVLTDHGVTLGDVPDEYLLEVLPAAKKIAAAVSVPAYNIMQVCRNRIFHYRIR